MKNSDGPLPLAVRIVVGIVSAILLVPFVLAVVARVHGAAIPAGRLVTPFIGAFAGFVAIRAQRYAWGWLILWVVIVADYAITFFR